MITHNISYRKIRKKISIKIYVVALIRSALARQGTSNAYHNVCFHGKIRKIFMWQPPLIRSYDILLTTLKSRLHAYGLLRK